MKYATYSLFVFTIRRCEGLRDRALSKDEVKPVQVGLVSTLR